MMKRSLGWLLVVFALLLGCGRQATPSAASEPTPKTEAKPKVAETPSGRSHTLTLYGYNYTNRYIDQFYVEGQGGANMDSGGASGGVCCIGWRDGTRLPQTWRVRWVSGGCKLLSPPNQFGERYETVRHFFKEKDVVFNGPVPLHPGYLEVHIYSDEKVEIAITTLASEPRLKVDTARAVDPYPQRCKMEK